MEPKFQSSFIPKGPIATPVGVTSKARRHRETSLTGFLSSTIFIVSVVLAVGVFGYTKYLDSSIAKMDQSLAAAKASLEAEPIDEYLELHHRIKTVGDLLQSHVALSPFFEFLESSTLQTVQFTDFDYASADGGRLEVHMKGQARGYAALALQSELFDKSGYFSDANFSNLTLDERGNVTFSFDATVDPDLVSYAKKVEREGFLNTPTTEMDSVLEELDQTLEDGSLEGVDDTGVAF